MNFQPYEALYIHIPFCKKRCNYCDFYTKAISVDDSELDAYLEQLILSIRRASKADLLGNLKTVYIGGGTPSFLGNKRLSNLLYTLSLSMHLTPEVECTLEANPESLTEAMVKDLFALGVTRLSLGVQSFDDEVLKTLGRIHDSNIAIEAIKTAQVRFENISIDLMCGLPGQSRDSFKKSLQTALELGVKHISVYPLILEEGTPFEKMEEAGEISIDDDLGALMMQDAQEVLTSAGMYRYEVASYCYPGFESRHNSAYWTGLPYLGIGNGAVTMKQNEEIRIRERSNKQGSAEIEDSLSFEQYKIEDVMLGMRMSKGVSAELIEEVSAFVPEVTTCFKHLTEEGFVVLEDNRFKPTEKGWLFGNQMYSEILSLEDCL